MEENHEQDQDHNHDNNHPGVGGSGGAPASSRWNPTKEQVNILEGLYGQGIRTPSADQIQQITERLRVFGHIEGKNVFYWFQNHKARQRQKQKQDTVAYINRHSVDHVNRFLHDRSVNTSHLQYPCPVVYGQYYVPIPTHVADPVGSFPRLYIQNNSPRTSTASSKKPRSLEAITSKSAMLPGDAGSTYRRAPQVRYTVDANRYDNGTNNQDTLALFPLSPTGILQSQDHDNNDVENSDDHDRRMLEKISGSTSRCYSAPTTSSRFEDVRSGDRTFYDFFSR